MKATFFAIVFSLYVVSFPSFAAQKNTQLSKPIVIINLNKADVSTLTHSFKGIGKKRAEAIIEYRDAHGDYRSVADLAGVRGLRSFVNKNLLQLQKAFAVG